MWKKIFKVVFYVLFAMTLLAVIGGAAVCIVYAAVGHDAVFYLYGALTFVLGIVLTFVAFSFTGMVIEMMDNIEAIRKVSEELKKPQGPVGTVIPASAAADEAAEEPAALEAAAEKETEDIPETVSESAAAETENSAPAALPENAAQPDSWICPTCGSVNPSDNSFCTVCGTKKH